MNIDANSITQAKILNKAIGGGGGGVKPTGTLSISSNGSYDVTNYAEAEVAVPLPSGTKQVTISDAGTTTEDVTDFEQVEIITQGLVKPTGTKEITENGTGIDVSAYASVNVNVSGGGGGLPTWDERGLSYNSWETIATYIRANELWKVAKIGEVKDNFRLVHINSDLSTRTLGKPNKATISNAKFGVELPLNPIGTADFLCINEISDVTGSTHKMASEDNPILNNLNSTIYDALPSDLKAVIIPRTQYVVNNYNTSLKTAEYTITEHNVWIPTSGDLGITPIAGLGNDTVALAGGAQRGIKISLCSIRPMDFFKQREVNHNDETNNVWLMANSISTNNVVSAFYVATRKITYNDSIRFDNATSVQIANVTTTSANVLYGVRIG